MGRRGTALRMLTYGGREVAVVSESRASPAEWSAGDLGLPTSWVAEPIVGSSW